MNARTGPASGPDPQDIADHAAAGRTADAMEDMATEERLAAELLATRKLLARIGASVPGAIHSFEISTDGTARMPFTTPAIEDVYGVSQSAMATDMSAWAANMEPDELARVNAGIAESMRHKDPWHELFRYRHPTKGRRWIEGWSIPMTEPDGRVVWHGFVMDVTDRQLAEQRVERLSRLYRTRAATSEAIVRAASEGELFQRVVDIVIGLGGLRVVRLLVHDPGRNVLVQAASAGDERLMLATFEVPLDPADPGSHALAVEAFRTRETILENDVPSLRPPRHVPIPARIGSALCLPLRRGGEVVAVIAMVADEKGYFDAEVAALVEAMAQDISFCLDHLARAHDLRESEERYRSLIENLEEVVYTTDLEGRITFISAACARFGYTPAELVGGSLFVLVHPEEMENVASRRQELLAGKHVVMEARGVDAGGKGCFVRLSARPLLAGGRVVGTQGVIVDLTRQRDTEEQLRLSQKMDAIGRLAGGVAHDFNNLLAVISSYTELAIGSLPPGSALQDDLGEVKRAAERAASLTRQLLAFSRKQVLQPKVIDVHDLLGGLRRMLERILGEDVELMFHAGAGVGSIRADAGQIEQVIMNLAVNARYAMPDGGKLVIATSRVDLGPDDLQLHPSVKPGPFVKIIVADTGTGMDSTTKARVFEPFFTTKPPGEGTGLGLATAYGIVEQSGGYITVESALGAGTTFETFLPCAAPAEVPARDADPAPARASGTETLLVVEDEGAVRNVVRRILTAAGYTVIVAGSPAEALRAFTARSAEIHLLLTDVVMPESNGRMLAARLTALRPDLRVIYMSGYTDDAILHRGVLEPGTHFLAKPFAANQLLAKVRAVLDGA